MTTDLALPAPATIATLHPSGAVQTWLSPKNFEEAERIATLMAKCGTMPAHLKNPSDAFRVVVQASKWGMDPFAVGEHTSLVHGRLCFEGKLVHGVLIAVGSIAGPLSFDYDDKAGDALGVTVTGTLRKSKLVKSITGTVGDWKTSNEFWRKIPREMLAYRGTRVWARMYAPEAMLGIITPDEVDDIRTVEANVVPETPAAKARELPPEPHQAPPLKEQLKSAPLFTPTNLVMKANEVHAEFGAKGLVAIRKFMDRIGVARVQDCAPEKVDEAMALLKDVERELHEGISK